MLHTVYDMNFDKTLCFTGHRPDKFPSYDYRHPENVKMLMKLKETIIDKIERRGIDTFITGMAIGVDIWSAQIVLKLKEKYPHIKLVCAIPCAEQYSRWNKNDIEVYHKVIKQADLVYYVSDEPYTPWCMHVRDKWMVDNAKLVIAVWDEGKDGGTWGTVKYAVKRQRNITHLHPKTLDVKMLEKI